MMRSLYSGVSGLKNHQTRMDVIGNNISNVNTIGFKTSRVVFQDIYSQTSKSASGPAGDTFDAVSMGGTNPIQIGLGVTLAAIDVLHTRSATQRTDRPLDLAIEGEGFFVVDTNGNTNDGGQMFTRAGNFYIDDLGNLVNANGYLVMGFDSEDDTFVDGDDAFSALVNINVAGFEDISIDDKGVVRGKDKSSGETEVIGRLAIAVFENVSGLEKKGSSCYINTANSGLPVYSVANHEGAGAINPGGLEMSNVDLASEFTDMIVTQRGFQANSRVITTSDQLLEELVNLKR